MWVRSIRAVFRPDFANAAERGVPACPDPMMRASYLVGVVIFENFWVRIEFWMPTVGLRMAMNFRVLLSMSIRAFNQRMGNLYRIQSQKGLRREVSISRSDGKVRS